MAFVTEVILNNVQAVLFLSRLKCTEAYQLTLITKQKSRPFGGHAHKSHKFKEINMVVQFITVQTDFLLQL